MKIDPTFGTLSLNSHGARYYIDNQSIYLPYNKTEDSDIQKATKVHELIHYYQCLSTSFGIYNSILHALRIVIIKGSLKAMTRTHTNAIWLPIMGWRNDVFSSNKTPIHRMIDNIRILDTALSVFDPWFFLKDISLQDNRYMILNKNYYNYYPFRDYFVNNDNSPNIFYPAPQGYTDNYSLLEGLSLYWEIAFRSGKVLMPTYNNFIDEISKISNFETSIFKKVFGTSLYARSFMIAEEYLKSDAIIFFAFMSEFALLGEMPHIRGWPPIPNYGRCGKGGVIPYENVNPGSRFEDIFFYFTGVGSSAFHKYKTAFENCDNNAILKIVDEICLKLGWKHPYNVIEEEINEIDLLLDYFSSEDEEIILEYKSVIEMLTSAKELLKFRLSNLFFLTFPSEIPVSQKPFIIFADGPEITGINSTTAVNNLIDSILCKMFFPFFEHSTYSRNDMQAEFICPASVDNSLSFLCPKIPCNDIKNCYFTKHLEREWEIGVNPIQFIL